VNGSGAWALAWTVALLVPLLSCLPFARYLSKRGQVDRPDARRTHQGSIPRGGGIPVALGLLLGLAVAVVLEILPLERALPIAALVAVLSGLGGVDDARGLGVRVRILLQSAIAVGVVALWADFETVRIYAGLEGSSPWVLSILAVLAFIWMMNLHNFMDGLDGLAAQQAIWSGLAYGVIFFRGGQGVEFLLAGLLVAAGLGFLVWNRPPARIFLGDSGSLLIGGLVGWFAIRALQTGAASLMACILISALFVVDATATLLRRVTQGERWYTPHRSHAYQRLADRQWSQGSILMLYCGVNVCIVLPALAIALVRPSMDAILTSGVVGVLLAGWWRIQSADNGERQAHD
jgi:Fuc2NAc and GlcNAc transferase